jgi:signal transduction histidine kinase
MNFKKIILIAFLIALQSNAYSNSHSFLKIDDKEDYRLEKHLLVLESPENLEILKVYDKYSSGGFSEIGNHVFNKGFSKSIWWFALALENQLDQENVVIFSAASSSLKEATLYVLDESGNITNTLFSGYNVPGKIRDVDSRLNSFRLILAPKERVILMLETDSRGRNIYMPFFLDSVDSYWQYEVKRGALYGGISTTLFFASLFALVLFIYLKERIYIIFIGYVMACLFVILEEDGYAYFWFYGSNFYQLSQIGIPLFGLLTCSVFLKFNLHFLETKKVNLPFFNIGKAMYYTAFLWCIALMINLFISDNFTVQFVLNRTALYLAMICLILVIMANLFQIRQKMGLYVLAANLFLVMGLSIYFFNTHGITSLNPFYPNGMVVGALVNVIAFTIGIGYRNYRDRIEKENLMVQLVENEKHHLQEKFQIQEEERQRIARDLHDDLGALMAMIRLKVEDALNKLIGNNKEIKENLSESVSLLEKAAKDIRFIAHELMPSEIEQKRFKTLISELFAMMEKQDKLDFSYHVGELPRLPIYMKTNLFRIIKETLNNTIKHAKASKADIEIFYDQEAGEIKMIMSDNGLGFDYQKIIEENKGIGLKNLETRVAYLKGRHKIISGPSGTKVEVSIPFEVKDDEQQ